MDLDPITRSQVNLKLFRNVKNTKELKQKLISGELKCCIVKPSLICNPFQIVVAANKALTAQKITTKSVYTELLFNLSVSKNITKSLQTFGIDDKDEQLLVVTIVKSGQVNEDVYKSIVGEEVDLSELNSICDLNAIKKHYKINDAESKNDITLINSIVSRIATKDFLSH